MKAVIAACVVVLVVSCGAFEGAVYGGPPEGSSTVADSMSTRGAATPAGKTLSQLLEAGPGAAELTRDEEALYNLLMEYRTSKGLPEIPVSKSLTFVAQAHVRDLSTHTFDKQYNSHSWSKDGPWTGGGYTPDHKNARLMWDKPRELTRYPGNGYEIALWAPPAATPAGALRGWQGSFYHNQVIVSEGPWARHPWKAIGIGMYGAYAVVWFGEESDPQR
ncbi:CAP domain-containing protein [Salinispira pacifica]